MILQYKNSIYEKVFLEVFKKVKKQIEEIFEDEDIDIEETLPEKDNTELDLVLPPRKGSKCNVKNLFNFYADRFEKSLLNDLGYQSPQIICEILKNSNFNFESALDLGCGTGLVGFYLKKRFKLKTLVGVDISEKMLEKAQKKKAYSNLFQEDAVEFLKREENTYNLITATDVLIYIGNLDELFYYAYKTLSENGLFCFDIELLNKEKEKNNDFYLRKTMRYAYNYEYILEKLEQFNFVNVFNVRETIRYESGEPVIGQYFIAEKLKS